VWNLETVKGASKPRPLYDWTTEDDAKASIVMSDEIIGGKSTSHLDFVSQPNTTSNAPSSSSSSSSTSQLSTSIPTSYARFHGHISTALPENLPDVKRTGYAAFRTPSQGATVFGRSYWDIDPYIYLALRIKSDGRHYFVNLQTESIEPSDIHQHRLFAKRPGEWETILLKWNDFVRTNHGFVIEPQTGMLRQKVRTLGIGLTDRVEGPFDFCIERAWATNNPDDGDQVVERKRDVNDDAGGGGLKTRKGTKVQW
jgi:NADH dehydrogenase [ubiquinone] 1 alpha subcomplex assembly factor 1